MRVLLVPNTTNEAARSGAAEVAAWLAASGFEPVLTQADATGSGLSDFGVGPAEIGEPVLVVALGGDGTILRAVHLLGGSEVPVLGVKYGRVGFLAGATPENMRTSIQTALAGEARLERRATLKAEVTMGGREVGSYLALNEVVVARAPSERVIAFELSVDGHRVMRERGDGVVIATATGSTAYALSAGGPIVAPGFGGMVVVPVAAHTLQSRAIVTDPTDAVEVTILDSLETDSPASEFSTLNSHRSEACVVVDGDPTPCRRSLERVTVSRGPADALLVKLGGRHFYETVANEFFG